MNQEVQNIEMTITQAEAKIAKMQQWEKLLANPLFDELVTKDYLGDDAVRLMIGLKPKTDDNEITNSMLLAKSLFSRYVGQVIDEGVTAIGALEEHKDMLREIDSEG